MELTALLSVECAGQMSSNYVLEFEMLGYTADLESALPGIEQSLRDRYGKILLGWAGPSTDPDTAGDLRGWFRSAEDDSAIGNFYASFEFKVDDPEEEGPWAFSSLRVVMDKSDVSSLMRTWEIIQLELERDGLLEGSGELDRVPRRAEGRPPLSEDEWIVRLRKADLANKMKKADPKRTYKEIVKEIDFDPGGTLESSVKMLQYARQKLERLEESDNAKDIELLQKVRDIE